MNMSAWLRLCAPIVAASMMLTVAPPAQAMVRGKPVHAIALYGEPKHGPNEGFAYNNPNAPKGGTLRLEAPAPTFDSLNSFSVKGLAASGLAYLGSNGIFVEGLTVSSDDEPFSQYCLICETMEVAEDNTWIEYTLRTEARFHDGTPVTPEDIINTFTLLREKGLPAYRLYWGDVVKVEKSGAMKVKFSFKDGNNPELPMIIGQVPILNNAFWQAHDLSASTLDIPVSTGPYRIAGFEPGRFIVYKRDPNYWGKDLAITRGTYNFDEIRFEYFRDDTVSFEAFKSGVFDVQFENTARRWATGYDFPAVTDGRVKKLEVPLGIPMTAQYFAYNLRRAKFQDRRVRQAMNYAFDFESLNKTIFYQQYTRLRSYWQTTDLEAKGLPSPEELALLEPWRGKIPEEVFTQEFSQPTTAGDGNPRDNLLKARDLLTAAGWDIVDGQLINKTTKEPFTFEMIVVSPTLERIILPWFQNLEKLGIKGTLRVIDASQIVNRVSDFDFEMISTGTINSLSPGNEQDEYWGSAAADRSGSRNISGVKDPAVDALIAAIIKAPDRPSLATATRALDRVLTWNFYTSLHYGPAANRYAYWTKLERPDRFPAQGMSAAASVAVNWWMNPAAAQTGESPTPATADAPAAEPGSPNRWLLIALGLGVLIVAVIFVRSRRG